MLAGGQKIPVARKPTHPQTRYGIPIYSRLQGRHCHFYLNSLLDHLPRSHDSSVGLFSLFVKKTETTRFRRWCQYNNTLKLKLKALTSKSGDPGIEISSQSLYLAFPLAGNASFVKTCFRYATSTRMSKTLSTRPP